jgi:hypothetical protein
MVKTINDGILARLLVVLPTYSKLSFGSNVSLNKFGRSSKRFGVIPKGASDSSGSVGVNTIDHSFEITLTDGYVSGPAMGLNDDLKMLKVSELQDNALLVYKDLQLNKNLLASGILIVSEINMSEVVFLEEENVAVLKFDLKIKYKV